MCSQYRSGSPTCINFVQLNLIGPRNLVKNTNSTVCHSVVNNEMQTSLNLFVVSGPKSINPCNQIVNYHCSLLGERSNETRKALVNATSCNSARTLGTRRTDSLHSYPALGVYSSLLRARSSSTDLPNRAYTSTLSSSSAETTEIRG